MEKENWIKWLQVRIPELKKSHNEYWLSLALDGYIESKQSQALLQPHVVGRSEQLCQHPFKKVVKNNNGVNYCSKCDRCI